LFAVAILSGRFYGAKPLTFPLDDHSQLSRDFVVLVDQQRPMAAHERLGLEIKMHTSASFVRFIRGASRVEALEHRKGERSN
jgi:hypothetical protein